MGGAATDPSGTLYVNANEMEWVARLKETPRASELEGLSSGERVYTQFCVACHGAENTGNDVSRVPSLVDLGQRMNRSEIVQIVGGGRGMMPGFTMLSATEKEAVADFLMGNEKVEGPGANGSAVALQSNFPPYKLDGYVKFLDSKGHPAISPPWGTLTAIDLNTGEHLWRIRLGNVDEYSKDGEEPTGTENYGGPVVTAGGLVFISATKDGKLRAFDKATGGLLWEVELPAPGYATPSVYEVDGKQFVAVAAGGTKLGSKRGDGYIAYSLPAKVTMDQTSNIHDRDSYCYRCVYLGRTQGNTLLTQQPLWDGKTLLGAVRKWHRRAGAFVEAEEPVVVVKSNKLVGDKPKSLNDFATRSSGAQDLVVDRLSQSPDCTLARTKLVELVMEKGLGKKDFTGKVLAALEESRKIERFQVGKAQMVKLVEGGESEAVSSGGQN